MSDADRFVTTDPRGIVVRKGVERVPLREAAEKRYATASSSTATAPGR